MVETFAYKRSQASLPQDLSPTVTVRPNMQASNAFKNLSNIVGQATKIKTAMVAEETSLTEEQIQEKEKELFVEGSNTFTALSSQFQQDYATAKNNREDLDTVTGQYLIAIDETFNKLPLNVQKGLAGRRGVLHGQASTAYTHATSALDKLDFNNALTTSMPAFLQSPKDVQKQMMDSVYSDGEGLGYTKAEIGKKLVEGIKAYSTVQLTQDEIERMQAEGDYSGYDNIISQLDSVQELNPFLKTEVSEAKKSFSKLKDSIDSVVKSRITGAIQTGDTKLFKDNIDKAYNNGAIGDEDIVIYQKKFIKSRRSDTGIYKEFWDKDLEASGGKKNLTNILDPKQREYQTKVIRAEITKKLVSDRDFDSDYLDYNATQNPEVFNKQYGQVMEDTISTLRDIIIMQPKDEQGIAQKQAGMKYLNDRMNKLLSVNNGVLTAKQQQDVLITQMAISGKIPNVQEFFSKLNTVGEVPTTSSSNRYIKKLKREVPFDSIGKAKQAFDTYLFAGMKERDAYDLASTAYSFRSIDGLDAKITSNLSDTLTGAGMPGGGEQYFIEAIQNADDLSYDVAVKLDEVLGGEGVKLSYSNGNVIIENEQGGFLPIPMNYKVLQAAAKESQILKADEEGLGVFGKAIDDLSANASSYIREVSGEWLSLGKVVIAPAMGKTDFLKRTNEAIMSDMATQKDLLTEMVDSVYNKGVTIPEATSTFVQKSFKSHVDNFKKVYKGVVDASEMNKAIYEVMKIPMNRIEDLKTAGKMLMKTLELWAGGKDTTDTPGYIEHIIDNEGDTKTKQQTQGTTSMGN